MHCHDLPHSTNISLPLPHFSIVASPGARPPSPSHEHVPIMTSRVLPTFVLPPHAASAPSKPNEQSSQSGSCVAAAQPSGDARIWHMRAWLQSAHAVADLRLHDDRCPRVFRQRNCRRPPPQHSELPRRQRRHILHAATPPPHHVQQKHAHLCAVHAHASHTPYTTAHLHWAAPDLW